MSKLLTPNAQIVIEQWENYQKQSFRNRTQILSANGLLDLTIPVVKATRQKVLTKDVLIDYATPWQKLHIKGIEAAYRNSPYYDYYIDDIIPFYEKEWKYLLEYNQAHVENILELLQVTSEISLSEDYITDFNGIDYRNSIHPKTSKQIVDPLFISKEYYQTFNDRFPFTQNLSILDALFNMGPETVELLR